MEQHRFYIPVDPPMTLEALKRVPIQQLLSRTLDDPAYGLFDARFEWQRYVNVRIPNPRLRHQVEKELDLMSSETQGQHRLRQAHAVRQLLMQSEPSIRKMPSIPILSGTQPKQPTLGAILLSGNETALTQSLANAFDRLRDPLAMLPAYAHAYDIWRAEWDAKRPKMETPADPAPSQELKNAVAVEGMDAFIIPNDDWRKEQQRRMDARTLAAPANPRNK